MESLGILQMAFLEKPVTVKGASGSDTSNLTKGLCSLRTLPFPSFL